LLLERTTDNDKYDEILTYKSLLAGINISNKVVFVTVYQYDDDDECKINTIEIPVPNNYITNTIGSPRNYREIIRFIFPMTSGSQCLILIVNMITQEHETFTVDDYPSELIVTYNNIYYTEYENGNCYKIKEINRETGGITEIYNEICNIYLHRKIYYDDIFGLVIFTHVYNTNLEIKDINNNVLILLNVKGVSSYFDYNIYFPGNGLVLCMLSRNIFLCDMNNPDQTLKNVILDKLEFCGIIMLLSSSYIDQFESYIWMEVTDRMSKKTYSCYKNKHNICAKSARK
jgi:hypothetical protein